MPTTVLVIDDGWDSRNMLDILLQDEGGYTVMETADPGSALDILHTTPHSLVVLFDSRMPHIDGEALLALAQQEAGLTERHAFVCMTGANRDLLPPTLMMLLALYEVPLVAKPFDIDDMLAVVREPEPRPAPAPAAR